MGPPMKGTEVAVIVFFVVISAPMLGGVIAHGRSLHFHLGLNLLPENSSEPVSVLSERTRRIDPMNGFKKYNGGYNITNKHYWSSTIFTGKYGYGMAVLWLVVGLVYAVIHLVTTICLNNKSRTGKRVGSKEEYFWPSVLGFIFVVLAIVASGVVLDGTSRFHSEAKSTKNTIERTAEEAYVTIFNITEALTAMLNETSAYVNIQGIGNLNSTSHNLNGEADNLQNKAIRNMHGLSKGISILEVVTIVTIATNLSVLLLLIASKALRLRRIFLLLIVICWLLAILSWVYFGLYYFLYKFSGDTCIAFAEYRQNPHNSSLGEVLPCSNRLSNNSVLQHTGAGMHNIINQLNARIAALWSASLPGGPDFICNPFSGPPDYRYQPENCSSNTIQVGDIPKFLKGYACLDEDEGGCQQGQFVSPTVYSRASGIASSIQAILDDYPSLESLVSCKLVQEAFSEILADRCGPLEEYGRVAWAGLAVLSAAMVLLATVWAVKAGMDSKWRYPDGFIRPHSTPTSASEDEMVVVTSSAGLQKT